MNAEDPASIELNSIASFVDEVEQSGSKEVFRSQQSLGLITQRFMSLRQKNEILNLNEVARELNIPKRRVYDVINVLEGLGYVQKIEKNNIQWIGDSAKSEAQDHLEATVELLRQEEKILEMMLKDAQAVIALHFEDPIARPYNYIRKEDIRKTADRDSKSIIIKSENDSCSNFEVQVTDPSVSKTYDMIIRNKKGIRSHALLFNNEPLIVKKETPEKNTNKLDASKNDWSLSDLPPNPVDVKVEADEIDTEDLETFVLPSSSTNLADAPYIPETPGRGIFFSPFKSLIDPCILPSFSEDLNSGFINITTPSCANAENSANLDIEPDSIMDFFND